jgi:outer membrane protein insertion porin family
VEGSPDQVDIVYTVTERSTGALLLGVGFSSVENVALSASLTQSNVFGTGKFLSFNINSGSVNTVYSLSYLDPYYTVDGVSRGFDVYARETDASGLAVGPYRTKALGGGVKFGYPVSETVTVDFGLNLESVDLETFASSPLQYLEFVEDFGNEYTYGTLTSGWARDTRDSLIQTNAGTYMRAALELAGADLQYYRLGYQLQWYRPLTRNITAHLGGELGYAAGYGGRPLPFFKNFFAGGPGTVRGYRTYSLGPQDINGNAVGGNRKFSGSAELLFPVPGAAQDRSLRLAAFVDGGQVFEDKYDFSNLRYSAGIALFWASPFGPLRLSWAHPLNAESGDRLQKLQFTFGTGF